MARLGKVSPCMFCGGLPCVCNAPAPKPEKKPQPKAAPVEAVQAASASAPAPASEFTPPPRKSGPFANFVHPTTALAAREGKPDEHVERLRAEALARVEQKVEAQDDLAVAMAVIRDAGILAPADQARVEREYPRIYPPEARKRANEWKKRNVQVAP